MSSFFTYWTCKQASVILKSLKTDSTGPKKKHEYMLPYATEKSSHSKPHYKWKRWKDFNKWFSQQRSENETNFICPSTLRVTGDFCGRIWVKRNNAYLKRNKRGVNGNKAITNRNKHPANGNKPKWTGINTAIACNRLRSHSSEAKAKPISLAPPHYMLRVSIL